MRGDFGEWNRAVVYAVHEAWSFYCPEYYIGVFIIHGNYCIIELRLWLPESSHWHLTFTSKVRVADLSF